MASMRDTFIDVLYELAQADKRLMLLTGDFGAPSLDKFRKDFPGQFLHMGIAEQNMVNVAAGLAMSGKIPYIYAIQPFVGLRCYEQWRQVCFDGLHVIGLGVGAGYSYDDSGPTHHALEDVAAMRALGGMSVYTVSDSSMAGALATYSYQAPGPIYIRLDRANLPPVGTGSYVLEEGLRVAYGPVDAKKSRDVMFVASGVMVHRAVEAAQKLTELGYVAGVLDIYRQKPLNAKLFLEHCGDNIVVLDESLPCGGLYEILAAHLANCQVKLLNIGSPDAYSFVYGGRPEIHRSLGLDLESILNRLVEKWGFSLDAVAT